MLRHVTEMEWPQTGLKGWMSGNKRYTILLDDKPIPFVIYANESTGTIHYYKKVKVGNHYEVSFDPETFMPDVEISTGKVQIIDTFNILDKSFRFLGYLMFKLRVRNAQVILADRFFPSTKMCSSCRQIHDMPLWKRTMECDCGHTMDRDLNAAINLMHYHAGERKMDNVRHTVLKCIQKEANLTKLQMAEVIGVTPERLSNLMRGTQAPTIEEDIVISSLWLMVYAMVQNDHPSVHIRSWLYTADRNANHLTGIEIIQNYKVIDLIKAVRSVHDGTFVCHNSGS